MWAQIINLLTGIFITLLPGLTGGLDAAARNHHYIAGPVAATFALVAIWEVNRNVRLFNIPVGAWMAAAPLILDLPGAIGWANAGAGLILIGLSLVKGRISKRYGGGWRSLLRSR